jgi:hypothetical protein
VERTLKIIRELKKKEDHSIFPIITTNSGENILDKDETLERISLRPRLPD